jgi:ABC-2 type transport system ATP-binding protein
VDVTIPARLDRVSKRFGSAVALDDVSFSLRSGETLALLGPNGAGKTTAVRALLGLIVPTGGTARIFGCDPRHASNRRRVGAMLQVAGLPATLTVGEQIALFRCYYPHPLALDEITALTGTRTLVGRRFGDLSGGQKQRVALALAICGDPDVLVLDEPSAALDVESRLDLWETIRTIVARGKSVLLTTHDLSEADALAHRVVVMQAGRVIADDSPSAMKAAIRAGTLLRFRSDLDDAHLRALTGAQHITRRGDAIEMHLTLPDAAIRALYAADPSFRMIALTEPDLEQAFLALTRLEIPA